MATLQAWIGGNINLDSQISLRNLQSSDQLILVNYDDFHESGIPVALAEHLYFHKANKFAIIFHSSSFREHFDGAATTKTIKCGSCKNPVCALASWIALLSLPSSQRFQSVETENPRHAIDEIISKISKNPGRVSSIYVLDNGSHSSDVENFVKPLGLLDLTHPQNPKPKKKKKFNLNWKETEKNHLDNCISQICLWIQGNHELGKCIPQRLESLRNSLVPFTKISHFIPSNTFYEILESQNAFGPCPGCQKLVFYEEVIRSSECDIPDFGPAILQWKKPLASFKSVMKSEEVLQKVVYNLKTKHQLDADVVLNKLLEEHIISLASAAKEGSNPITYNFQEIEARAGKPSQRKEPEVDSDHEELSSSHKSWAEEEPETESPLRKDPVATPVSWSHSGPKIGPPTTDMSKLWVMKDANGNTLPESYLKELKVKTPKGLVDVKSLQVPEVWDSVLYDGKEELLRGIYAYGFEKPSAIQMKVHPLVCSGVDVMFQSPAGTGKSAALISPLLWKIDPSSRTTQAMILAPSRELAVQLQKVILALGDYAGITVGCLIGGLSVRESMRAAQKKPHVIVGTAGRVFDMIQRKALVTKDIKILGLDEVEEMCSRGTRDALYDVFRHLPPEVQVVCCGSVIDGSLEFSRKFLNPTGVWLLNENLVDVLPPFVKNFFVNVEREDWKIDTVFDLLDSLEIAQMVIFVNTRRKADWVTEQLRNKNFPVSCLHGDLTQSDRTLVLNEFRAGSTRILISTLTTLMGIDVQQVNVVINFDMPQSWNSYVMQVGRAGRFGRKGVSISLLTTDDLNYRIAEMKYFMEELPADISTINK